MVRLLYNLFIRLYPFIIHVVAPFNPKARQWVRGRKNIFPKLQMFGETAGRVVWMHCASLGEFEQGRPLLEKLRQENPSYRILLTFFSPSGYEIQKDYSGADLVCYLPMDSRSNARQFFETVKPSLVLFVKYEFWYYYLNEAKSRSIPLLLISGIFRSNQPFFKWYGGVHREMLQAVSHFFLQNQQSAELLRSIGISQNVMVNGDTRFDRVIQIARNFTPIPFIEQFCGDYPVIVAGSTWTDDDEELDHFANTQPELRFIIAPHDIGPDRMEECRKLYKNAVLYSELAAGDMPENANTLLVDNIGMLSRLYRYGTICYVGGGFGDDGVHNILEAAVYGKPVIFGPEFEKFFEAGELISFGGAFSVESALELEQLLQKLLLKDERYVAACEAAEHYVLSKKGPTEAIVNFIYENRLLTS